jgi:pantothenate kinase type III
VCSFYNGNHPSGILKVKEFHDKWVINKNVMKKSAECSLLVSYVFKLQTVTMQCENRCVLFHVVTEVNHELCGAVRRLHGFCGR